jgi:hypothetical protein
LTALPKAVDGPGSASLLGRGLGRLGRKRLGLLVFFFLRQAKGAQTDGLGVVGGGFGCSLLLDQRGALFPGREMTVGVAAGGFFLGRIVDGDLLSNGAAALRPPPLITLGELDVGGFGAARIRLNVELDLLAFVQAADTSRFESRGMDEHVLAAVFWRDETETLGGVEKLHGADGHFNSFTTSGYVRAYAWTAVETMTSGL